ncbi:hypothetical protein [Streptosporangium sp. H16]
MPTSTGPDPAVAGGYEIQLDATATAGKTTGSLRLPALSRRA